LNALHKELLNRGVLSASYGLFALSTPMTQADAEMILEAVDDALRAVAEQA
jgi:glutamate-1-semialdehyde 2,1-aminomutase